MDLDSIVDSIKDIIRDIGTSVEDEILKAQKECADVVFARLSWEYSDDGTVTISREDLRNLLDAECGADGEVCVSLIDTLHGEISYFESTNTINDIEKIIGDAESEHDSIVKELEDTKSDLTDAEDRISELEDELQQTKEELDEISRILHICQGRL